MADRYDKAGNEAAKLSDSLRIFEIESFGRKNFLVGFFFKRRIFLRILEQHK
jgi:hypothetical protein